MCETKRLQKNLVVVVCLLFPANKASSSHKVSKLIENEKHESQDKDFCQLDEKEAENLRNVWTARKKSMLRKDNSANTSEITYCRVCVNTKMLCLFKSMTMMKITKKYVR